jgi:alkylation response protein AidB-like acyl-CoA dehydrogenase
MGDQRQGSAYPSAGSTDWLWPDVEHLLASTVCDDLASRAAEDDLTGHLHNKDVEVLRDAGYFGLPVPKEFEGGGASAVECCAVQRRVSAANPGLAIALNMHLFSVGVMVEHWRRRKDESWLLLEAISSQRRIVASAFAEPGLGGSLLRSNCTAKRVESGWRVSGIKAPCSLARRSDLLCLQVSVEDDDDRILVGLVPTAAEGIHIEQTWDSLGMRASESDTVRFEDCFIPDELVFHDASDITELDAVFAAGVNWFCATTLSTYLGIARSVIETTRHMLSGSRLDYLGTTRLAVPTIQLAVGEAAARVVTCESSCLSLARLLDSEASPQDVLPIAVGIKYFCLDALRSAIETLIDTVGARAYGRSSPLERLWRDSQASRFHPPTSFASRQIVGRWTAGIPFSLELDDRPVK